MDLKGIIKFFTVVFFFVCAYELSFTFFSQRVENKADEYAAKGVPASAGSRTGEVLVAYQDSVEEVKKARRRFFLDSMQNQVAYNLGLVKYTYKECNEKQIRLGLDLKGGMSLVLEIAQDEVLIKGSENSKDPAFNLAIKNAKARVAEGGTGDFMTVFTQEYKKAAPDGKLAAIFASLPKYQKTLTFASTNDQVIGVLRDQMTKSVNTTFETLKTRINQFGVASPTITLQSNTGRIILELPGVDDPGRIRRILQQTAQLEFWDTWENEEIYPSLVAADKALGDKMAAEKRGGDSTSVDTTAALNNVAAGLLGNEPAANDTANKTKKDSNGVAPKATASKKDSSEINPLFKVLGFVTDQGGKLQAGAGIGLAFGKDTAKIDKYLSMDVVKAAFPRNIKFIWSAKSRGDNNVYELFAIKTNQALPGPPMGGEVITDARAGYDPDGSPDVTLNMNPQGAAKWERMTDEATKTDPHRSVAIALDNRVFSAPRVTNKISGGNTQITGMGSVQESNDLANILRSGQLEARTKIIEEQVIGPSLGSEAIKSGLLSLLVAFVLVCLFMVAYYSTSGIVANIAVILNLFFIISLLANFSASLTLPGLAGIVLTLAIAIDANVIINERIREELAKGKGVRAAVTDGYKHSYSAIIDGNVTTLIVGIVLTFFGYGPVKGFAITLVLGILTSLFTAVGFTQVIFDWIFKRNWEPKFGNKFTMNVLTGMKIQFMSFRKISYTISTIAFVVSFAAMIIIGFDLGVAFKGGRSYVVKFDKEVKTADIAAALEKPLESKPLVKTYGSNSQIQVTTAYMIASTASNVDSIIEGKLYEGVAKSFGNKPSFEKFRASSIKSITKIDATIADDIKKSALYSGLLGCLFIFIYIYIRFRKWEYAVGAIAATVHDPVIVLGLFSLLRYVMPFSLEVDENVVAAILTLIGYSVNDTVIVFDRIREYIKLYPGHSLIHNVNDSINSTLSRTIMTSAATEVVCIVLFIFGGDAIRQFSFALMIGIAVGTYSSIFIASPIMVDLLLRRKDTLKADEK
ncbi:MAG: protein-export rane protein SecD/SecF family [Bacteroidetes bacterium]|nr:protein-export rane protein SecD/SecF family [Bacteroidota bacterium]